MREYADKRFPGIERRFPVALRALVYATMIVFTYHARPRDVNPFVYFQF